MGRIELDGSPSAWRAARLVAAAGCFLFSLGRPAWISAAPPGALAEELSTELEATFWGQPFEEWRATHATATCESGGEPYGYGADDEWCHRCTRRLGESSLEAHFYVFDLEEPLVCRLEQLHLTTGRAASDDLRAAHTALVERLSEQHGPAQEPVEVHEFGAAYWTDVRRWAPRGGQLYLYLRRPEVGDEPLPYLGLLARRRVLLDARAQDGPLHRASAEPLPRLTEDLLHALRAENPEAAALFERASASAADDVLRAAVMELLEASAAAPAESQPLLLLAADRLANGLESDTYESPEWERHRQALAPHGISFEWSQLGYGWFYTHTLLWRAWEEHPDSPWGEVAFVLLLADGWDTSVKCAKGSGAFRRVITEGERFLAARPDSRLRPRVQLAVAQAYETWWSLSRARSDDYVHGEAYETGASEAREKAIRHYRELLRVQPGSGEAAYARRQLPRLSLGVDTGQRRFFCIYD